jgi:dTDP-4-amino-4,6-dideoxygalactose transaminase
MKNSKFNFNKPYLSGEEISYIVESIKLGHISGNGHFTKKCQTYFEENYNFKKCLLTTSCTDALEMAAILAGIQHGDEVIIPSYTFVSTAIAFIRQGARIVFADSNVLNPNIDVEELENLITPKTKAIVPVHYAGIACDMDKIMDLAHKYNLIVIEDAAQAIDSFYFNKYGEKKALGSIGHFGAFSFHETKNIISGEGGMLTINHEKYIERAEIIWEKGTNRSKFFRGEIDKYSWVDTGSSFLPSEIIAAFLWGQLENIEYIQNKRREIWRIYYESLIEWANNKNIMVPFIPDYATNNGHMFYLVFKNLEERTSILSQLKSKNINAVFHYQSLHSSEFFNLKHDNRILTNSERYSNCLIRLPFYFELTPNEIINISNCVKNAL